MLNNINSELLKPSVQAGTLMSAGTKQSGSETIANSDTASPGSTRCMTGFCVRSHNAEASHHRLASLCPLATSVP